MTGNMSMLGKLLGLVALAAALAFPTAPSLGAGPPGDTELPAAGIPLRTDACDDPSEDQWWDDAWYESNCSLIFFEWIPRDISGGGGYDPGSPGGDGAAPDEGGDSGNDDPSIQAEERINKTTTVPEKEWAKPDPDTRCAERGVVFGFQNIFRKLMWRYRVMVGWCWYSGGQWQDQLTGREQLTADATGSEHSMTWYYRGTHTASERLTLGDTVGVVVRQAHFENCVTVWGPCPRSVQPAVTVRVRSQGRMHVVVEW